MEHHIPTSDGTPPRLLGRNAVKCRSSIAELAWYVEMLAEENTEPSKELSSGLPVAHHTTTPGEGCRPTRIPAWPTTIHNQAPASYPEGCALRQGRIRGGESDRGMLTSVTAIPPPPKKKKKKTQPYLLAMNRGMVPNVKRGTTTLRSHLLPRVH